MKLKKAFLAYVIFTLIFITMSSTNSASAASDILDVQAHSAILVDASSGRILYEKESEVALPTASMTKMMTEYLVLEAVANNKITWEQETGITEYVYKISQNRSLSNVPLRSDGKYTVKELYEAMAIYSANGATIALAELVAGSETNFVKMMNDKANELGLETYKFVNSTGLNNKDLLGMHPGGTSVDEENLMSAKGTAKLAFHLLKDYPEVLDTASIPKKKFREGTSDEIDMSNWNWMLPSLIYGYEGIDGLKTGSTELAGYCFTSTAERNGVRFITVVMKTNSYEARFDETRKLLDYGFSNFGVEEIVPAGYQDPATTVLPVDKGKEKEVSIQSTNAISLLIKSGEKELFEPVITYDETLLNEEGALTAPIEKGLKVGSLSIAYKGEGEMKFLTSDSGDLLVTDIVTTASVEKSSGFVLFFKAIGGFFSDLWSSAAGGIKGLFS